MTETQKTTEQHLEIQRIYVKDLSLESPASPQIFQEEWRPEVSIDLDVNHDKIEKDVYEVVLTVTVTAKHAEKTVFLAEVRQAGIFNIVGFPGEPMEHLLGSYCPSVLFPYAREAISDLVAKGSFPQLVLTPINFDALLIQKKQAEAETDKSSSEQSGEKTH